MLIFIYSNKSYLLRGNVKGLLPSADQLWTMSIELTLEDSGMHYSTNDDNKMIKLPLMTNVEESENKN